MTPVWIQSILSEQDFPLIEASVAKAELGTSGEIVPVIVHSSSFDSHVGILLTLIFFTVFSVILPFVIWHLPGELWIWEIAAVILSFLLGWVFARSGAVRRLLTPARDQAAAVFRRAQLEFHETGIPATVDKTGVMIFVSVHEHRAVILGDAAISAKLKPEVWVEILNEMLAKFGEGKAREGLELAIEKVGVILSREFPIKPGDVNELSNSLVVKD